MSKYKVIYLCYDFEGIPPYFDEGYCTYPTRESAENSMFRSALCELEELNGILEDDTFPERRFISTLEDEEYDVVINCWDGPDYRHVTCYKVGSIEELLVFFNKKLRETHGSEITVHLESYEEDDGSIQFYYTSMKYGDSVAYSTVSEAYEEANRYLHNVGELW